VKQRWQSAHRRIVCGFGTSRCPQTVRCQEVADQVLFARDCRVRGRGSHVQRPRSSLQLEERERVAHQGAGIRDAGLGAEAHSLTQPRSSSSTPALGSSPQRPVRRQARPLRSITRGATHPDQQRCRVLPYHTRRAHVWARTVRASPWLCLRSKRARDLCPAGFWRRHTTAASEKAPVRDALPIVVPEGPSRVPADALAHVTRRQKATKSWPRGKRLMAWSS
jgi:hypothetical protein